MKQVSFPFKTSFQCVLETKEQFSEIRMLFRLLRREGFYGVELNLPDLGLIKPEELHGLLKEYGLKMDMLATGAYAKTHHLSLSSAIPSERQKAVEGCRQNIDYAAAMGCGIILGFFKGGPESGSRDGEQHFLTSMMELKPYIEEKQVLVLLEATNHKESSIIRTLKDGARIIDCLDSPLIRLLADTYHMNIEETSVLDSLKAYQSYYPHLHISDNNRAFPGLGSMDFTAIYEKLIEMDYKGTLAVEGNIQNSLLFDIEASAAYLHNTCRNLSLPSPNHFDISLKMD